MSRTLYEAVCKDTILAMICYKSSLFQALMRCCSYRIELERPDSCVSSIYSLESDEDVEKEMKPELR